MTTLNLDITNLGLTDVETGNTLTGSKPIKLGSLRITKDDGLDYPLNTAPPTLREITYSINSSFPDVDLQTIKTNLENQGFESYSGANGTYSIFADGNLGIDVRVYWNSPTNIETIKITWQSWTRTINQETGEIESSSSDVEHIYVMPIDIYKTAYGKVSELLSNYSILS